MKLFGVIMELAIFLPTLQSGQWLCSLEYRKSFPNINKKFFYGCFSLAIIIFSTGEFLF